jgi:hypothetical protein
MPVSSPRAAARAYPGVPAQHADVAEWLQAVAGALNGVQQGRLNIGASITLTANQATTVISDPRLHTASILLFMPTTANAAAEIGAGGLYVSAQAAGSATVTHANNAQTDRTFRVALLG